MTITAAHINVIVYWALPTYPGRCLVEWALSKNPVCRQEAASQIAIAATPFIRGNPIAKRAGGNACAVSSQDNVEQSESPIWINCQDKTL